MVLGDTMRRRRYLGSAATSRWSSLVSAKRPSLILVGRLRRFTIHRHTNRPVDAFVVHRDHLRLFEDVVAVPSWVDRNLDFSLHVVRFVPVRPTCPPVTVRLLIARLLASYRSFCAR